MDLCFIFASFPIRVVCEWLESPCICLDQLAQIVSKCWSGLLEFLYGQLWCDRWAKQMNRTSKFTVVQTLWVLIFILPLLLRKYAMYTSQDPHLAMAGLPSG